MKLTAERILLIVLAVVGLLALAVVGTTCAAGMYAGSKNAKSKSTAPATSSDVQ